MGEHRTRRPLIGVTAGTARMMSGAWEGHDAVVLTEHYVTALRAAGARPVILAPQDEWTADEVAELDAVVLTGGTDLDPDSYGELPDGTGFTPDPERDAFEIALFHAARAAGVPVLGVCRGLQIIAVATGGTLFQHLPRDLPAHPVTGERITAVDVDVDAASDLAVAIGTRAVVQAFHHQGVAEHGEELRVVARHASGLALALEAAEGSPVMAVQWHPELDDREAQGDGIFAALVSAAALRAPARTVDGASTPVV